MTKGRDKEKGHLTEENKIARVETNATSPLLQSTRPGKPKLTKYLRIRPLYRRMATPLEWNHQSSNNINEVTPSRPMRQKAPSMCRRTVNLPSDPHPLAEDGTIG